MRQADEVKSGIRRVSAAFFLTLSASLLSSCGLYLHNPANQTTATDARGSYLEIVARRSGAGFTTGYLDQRAATNKIGSVLSDFDRDSQIAALSAKTWDELRSSLCSELIATTMGLGSAAKPNKELRHEICRGPEFSDIDQQISEAAKIEVEPSCNVGGKEPNRVSERNCVERQLQEALSSLPGAKSAVESLTGALDAAARDEARYIATQKLLSAGLLALVGPTTTNEDRAAAITKVLNEEVMLRKFEKDNTGDLIETSSKTTVGDALAIDAQAVSALTSGTVSFDNLIQLTTATGKLKSFEGLLPASPGIEVTIVGLSYDVARAEELRLRNIINSASRRISLYNKQIEFLKQHLDRLENTVSTFDGIDKLPGVRLEDDLRTTILSVRTDASRRDELALVYGGIGQWTFAVLYAAKTRTDFRSTIDALDAEESLAQADVAFREREAVIGRGLQGLVAFHEGGINAQDFNNLIQVAQAIGIFAIAAQ